MKDFLFQYNPVIPHTIGGARVSPKKNKDWIGDWLDDEDESSGLRSQDRKQGKNKKPPVDFLDPTEANAKVVEVFPGQAQVELDDTKARINCSYRKAKLPTQVIQERAPVAVGDRVLVEVLSPQSGVICGVGRRQNALIRPTPEKETPHVITTNIDCITIVVSIREPDFSIGIVDRFLVATYRLGITPVICVTKMDLLNGPEKEEFQQIEEIYGALGIKCFALSKLDKGDSLESLKLFLQGQRVVFCGHSGVGKTTLLNRLIGAAGASRKTGEVNAVTGKGKHTTTGAYMIPDTNWVDTPGIRAFGFIGLPALEVLSFFPELQKLTCTAKGCFHRKFEQAEGLCMATEDLPRLKSYQNIVESLS